MHDQLPGHLLSVYRFAMYLCGDQHVAEDLTQEAMLRALRNLHSLNDPTTLKIWLFRIVKNLWTDKCRSKSQQATSALNDEELAGIVSEPVTVAEMEEEVARTLEAMQNLPCRQREVLHLIACQHFSVAEVAGVLEISPEAVRSSLSLARAQMRKMVYPKELNSLPQCNRRVRSDSFFLIGWFHGVTFLTSVSVSVFWLSGVPLPDAILVQSPFLHHLLRR